MKRLFSCVLALCILVTAVPTWATVAGTTASGTCGSNLTWTIDSEHTLIINGSGPMYNWDSVLDVPWYSKFIRSVQINSGVTTIGDRAFCDLRHMQSVSIPEGVTSIGRASFFCCYNLTEVVIPGSVTSIGGDAFADCHRLERVIMEQGVVDIGLAAFCLCDELREVTIPNSVVNIRNGAFAACSQLTNVYYLGSSSEWYEISIGSDNESLLNAKRHYVAAVPVSSVLMTTASARLKIGETKQLSAQVLPQNATNKVLSWSSSNPAVATVNANGVVTAKSVGTAKITVRSSNGKSASCVVTVNARGIDYDDFKYAFYNSYDSFGYPYHYDENGKLVSDYKIPLLRYAQAGFTAPMAGLLYTCSGMWGGSCFGMSASSVLFYKDVLKEGKYDKSATTPKDFGEYNSVQNIVTISSDKYTKLREMIELFHVSQSLALRMQYRDSYDVNLLIEELDLGNPAMLDLKDENGNMAHSVVVYDYNKNASDYTFYIYDNARYVESMTYNQNGFTMNYTDYYKGSTKYNPNKYHFGCFHTYETIKSTYDYMYACNKYNIWGGVTLLASSDNPEVIYMICPAADMSIVNAAGETAIITNGTVNSEFENIQLILSSDLAAEPIYTIILPTDTYTIVGSGDEVITTSFADDYMSASVTAKSSTPITISSDLKEISADTAAGEAYTVRYTTHDNLFDEMTLSGTAAGGIAAVLNGAAVTLTGADTLNATATVSDAAVSANAEGLSERGEASVICEAADSGATLQIVSVTDELTEKAALPERLTADSPVYDLESGTYTEGQTLTFTKDDETIIYYTTDGSTPSEDNGIIYSLPVEINKSMTVKAISTKYGYTDSEVLELNYTLPEVEMPQASHESGTYNEVISVSLSTAFAEDAIYYTTDGSDPVENGILYTVPVNISGDAQLRAYTVRNGCVSEASQYDYTVVPDSPFYFSNSMANQEGEILTADNISALTKVKLTVSKLHAGEQAGLFMVALYDAENRLICIESKAATVTEDVGEIIIDITEDVSTAHTIKAFVWGDLANMLPLGRAAEELVAETEEA